MKELFFITKMNVSKKFIEPLSKEKIPFIKLFV